jgi:hypothetical protein
VDSRLIPLISFDQQKKEKNSDALIISRKKGCLVNNLSRKVTFAGGIRPIDGSGNLV